MDLNVNNFGIDVNEVFNSLDRMDSNQDNKINVSIWNNFADQVGGNHIRNFIEQKNAVRSIRYYLSRGREVVEKICNFIGIDLQNGKGPAERLNNAEELLQNTAEAFENGDFSSVDNFVDNFVDMNKAFYLNDGRYISVRYGGDGEITSIGIGSRVGCEDENNLVEIYNDSSVNIDATPATDAPQGGYRDSFANRFFTLTQGVEFEKYKALAERIIGSYEKAQNIEGRY